MKKSNQKIAKKQPEVPKAGRKRAFSITIVARSIRSDIDYVDVQLKVKLPNDINGKKLSSGLKCPRTMLDTKNWKIKQNETDTNILQTMRENVKRAYLAHISAGKRVKYQPLFDAAFGQTEQNRVTVNQAIERFLAKEYLSSTSEWKPTTKEKNIHHVRELKDFLTFKFKSQAVDFDDLSPQTAEDLIFWAKSTRNQTSDTAGRLVKYLRRIINFSIANNWTKINPLLSFKFKPGHKFIIALTEEEIKAFMELELKGENLILTRDLFVFCIFSCMAYSELANLKYGNVKQILGEKAIILNRQKLGNSRAFIPLLPEAEMILEKYKPSKIKDETPCFDVPTNQMMNLVLKELGAMAEISKNLTCHVARKSGATYLLNRGVPIEIVQKICGHQSVKVTQTSYAQLYDKTVMTEIRKMKERNGG